MVIKNKICYILFLLLCIPTAGLFSQTTGNNHPVAKDEEDGTTRALIIGILDYKNLRDLNFAHSDAVAFYNYLISPFGGYVHPQNVVLLLNDAATAANIFCVLDWLIDESFKNDRVIIFFAGHGDTESKLVSREGFLLCYDSPVASYRACGLSISDLQDYIRTLTAINKSEVILITDACRAGNLAGDYDGMIFTTAVLAEQWGNVIKVLSSKPGEYSFENKKWGQGSGVFSYFLINGLLGLADKDTNNHVTGIELYSYLAEHVPEETENNQTPLFVGDPMYVLSDYIHHDKDSAEDFFSAGIRSVEDPSTWHVNYVRNISDSLTYTLYRDFWECIDQQNLLPARGLKTNALDLYKKSSKR